MFNVFTEIAWLSVLVAFVTYSFLGGMWFTVLFPKQYLASLGRAGEVQGKPALIFIIGPAICALVITIASAVLMYALQIDSYENALLFAGVAGFGYLVANTVNIAINPNMPRPLYYGLITGSYHLVGIVLICLILVAMK